MAALSEVSAAFGISLKKCSLRALGKGDVCEIGGSASSRYVIGAVVGDGKLKVVHVRELCGPCFVPDAERSGIVVL